MRKWRSREAKWLPLRPTVNRARPKPRAPTYSFQEYLQTSALPGCANSLNENPEHLCTRDSGGLTKGLIKSTLNKNQIVVVFCKVQMFFIHALSTSSMGNLSSYKYAFLWDSPLYKTLTCLEVTWVIFSKGLLPNSTHISQNYCSTAELGCDEPTLMFKPQLPMIAMVLSAKCMSSSTKGKLS